MEDTFQLFKRQLVAMKLGILNSERRVCAYRSTMLVWV